MIVVLLLENSIIGTLDIMKPPPNLRKRLTISLHKHLEALRMLNVVRGIAASYSR